jgi:pyruvate dehydrogenase phosphatase
VRYNCRRLVRSDLLFSLVSGIGDIPFKQPPEFTRRILYNIFPGYSQTSAWEEFLDRNLTAPYISSEPDVIHRKLSPLHKNGYLIMCSDGLIDLFSSRHTNEQHMVDEWARLIASGGGTGGENLALKLLRHAIGGSDVRSVSRVLTLDMDSPWIDDTTILVQSL